MSKTSLQMLFSSPWGILEGRKTEIERGGYGEIQKIINEEINKLFTSFENLVLRHPAISPSKMRKILKEHKVKYIVPDKKRLYLNTDLSQIPEDTFKGKQNA